MVASSLVVYDRSEFGFLRKVSILEVLRYLRNRILTATSSENLSVLESSSLQSNCKYNVCRTVSWRS